MDDVMLWWIYGVVWDVVVQWTYDVMYVWFDWHMVKCLYDALVFLIYGVTMSLVYALMDKWLDVNTCDCYIVQLAIAYDAYVIGVIDMWCNGVLNMWWCSVVGMGIWCADIWCNGYVWC